MAPHIAFYYFQSCHDIQILKNRRFGSSTFWCLHAKKSTQKKVKQADDSVPKTRYVMVNIFYVIFLCVKFVFFCNILRIVEYARVALNMSYHGLNRCLEAVHVFFVLL